MVLIQKSLIFFHVSRMTSCWLDNVNNKHAKTEKAILQFLTRRRNHSRFQNLLIYFNFHFFFITRRQLLKAHSTEETNTYS